MPGAFPSPAAPTKGAGAAATVRTRMLAELSDSQDSDVEFLADTFKAVQISAAGES